MSSTKDAPASTVRGVNTDAIRVSIVKLIDFAAEHGWTVEKYIESPGWSGGYSQKRVNIERVTFAKGNLRASAEWEDRKPRFFAMHDVRSAVLGFIEPPRVGKFYEGLATVEEQP